MTMGQLTILVQAFAIILGAVIAIIIRPYFESKVSAETLAKYEGYVKVAIRCAEQLFTAEQWAQKKDWVFHYAVNKAAEFGIEISEEDINVLVEGFVNEIKKG